MDTSWVYEPRASSAYWNGVADWMRVEYEKGHDCLGRMKCPCKECYGFLWYKPKNVREHLIIQGFNYEHWIFDVPNQHQDVVQPESSVGSNDMKEMFNDDKKVEEERELSSDRAEMWVRGRSQSSRPYGEGSSSFSSAGMVPLAQLEEIREVQMEEQQAWETQKQAWETQKQAWKTQMEQQQAWHQTARDTMMAMQQQMRELREEIQRFKKSIKKKKKKSSKK